MKLPNGVFAPYTNIPTNLLFFDRSQATSTIWFYEHPLPEGRKNYTKTKPLQFEEFADCIKWWRKRKKCDQAWKVDANELVEFDEHGAVTGLNLNVNNPNSAEALEHLPPEQLVADILTKEEQIIAIVSKIKQSLEGRSV